MGRPRIVSGIFEWTSLRPFTALGVCWGQASLMIKRGKLPPDVMGFGTGFHANQAGQMLLARRLGTVVWRETALPGRRPRRARSYRQC